MKGVILLELELGRYSEEFEEMGKEIGGSNL
jgi:hypothetical protein